MQQKKQIKYFIIVSVILISLLPTYNFYQYAKQYNYSKLFNIDTIEKYINYTVYRVLNRSMVQNSVVVGKDNFLFLGNGYANIVHKTNGTYKPSQKEIDSWTDKLKTLQSWYNNRGIKFVIVIAPNKHTIYKDKLPYWMQYDGKTITDDIVEYANKKNINILDLRTSLMNKKKNDDSLLYFKSDTHWNLLGASYGYSATMDYINKIYDVNLTKPTYTISDNMRSGGDLANFLKIGSILSKDYENGYKFNIENNLEVCHGNINRNNGHLERCENKKNLVMGIGSKPQYMINNNINENKKLLFLCDSFGSAPSELYNLSFNTIYKWYYGHINSQKLSDFVIQNEPDFVIYQIVERDLYNNGIVSPMPDIINIKNDEEYDLSNMIFDIKNSKENFYKNNHLEILTQKDIILLNVRNTDPIIILNQTKSISKNVVLSYEIESKIDTTFQLFYKKDKLSKYNETDSYKVTLAKGVNKINLMIPSRYINNDLRVDLVSSIGTYKINRFKIYDQ